MRKITKYLAGVIAAALTIGTSAFAAEYSVTPVQATWYTNDQTVICSDADANTVVVPTCDSNILVNIIGVTSNGFWQVQLDQVYYIPGAGLSAQANSNTAVNTTANNTNATATTGNNVWHKKDWLGNMSWADKDLTSNPTYITIRNEYERQYAAGYKTLRYRVRYSDENHELSDITRQIIWDMEDDYSNIEKDATIYGENMNVINEGTWTDVKINGAWSPVRSGRIVEIDRVIYVQ